MHAFRNKILSHLDAETIDRLALRPVELERDREIEAPGNTIDNLFFLETGIGSMTTTFLDGSQVEVGMFGYESVMGASALIGTLRSLNRVYMQVGGRGYACRLPEAKREFGRFERFNELVLRYVQAQLIQASQSAGCNAKHEADQRLARWLLLCRDRAQSDTLPLKQEFLADMLGTSRPTVSIAAQQLHERGLIDYKRGVVRIVDAGGLERLSCECYQVVKSHLDNYLEVKQS
jgi:CRP-like cAMP-binding protein